VFFLPGDVSEPVFREPCITHPPTGPNAAVR